MNTISAKYNSLISFLKSDSVIHQPNYLLLFIGVILLMICGVMITYNAETYMDLLCADEAAYMGFGLKITEKVETWWGPLYSLWYYFLHQLTSKDAVELYYLNFKIMKIAVPIFMYLLFSLHSKNYTISFLLSFLYLCSKINLSTWPYISDFCAILILINLLIIYFLKKSFLKLLWMSCVLYVICYARPEFLLASIFLFLIAMNVFVAQKKWKNSIYIFFFILIVVLINYLFFPLDFSFHGSFEHKDRSFAALIEHYPAVYKITHKSSISTYIYLEQFKNTIFADCDSILGFIIKHPLLFIRHAFYCTLYFFIFIFNFLLDTFIPAYLYKYHAFIHKIAVLVGFAMFFGMIYLTVKNRKNLKSLFTIDFLIFFIILIPSSISCMMIAPRTHYLVLHILFILMFFLHVLNISFSTLKFNSLKWILITGFLVITVLIPIKKIQFEFKFFDQPAQQNMLKLIRFTQQYKPTLHHVVYTDMLGFFLFQKDNYTEISALKKPKKEGFLHLMQDYNINMVIISKRFLQEPYTTLDPEWKLFFNDYKKYGFKRIDIKDAEPYLLVKDAL